MSRTLCLQDGSSIVLGREIGRGGEGAVYAVDRQPGRVVKLYNGAVDPQKQQKLRAMVSAADPSLKRFTAWPEATVHLVRGGPVAGFIMPMLPDRMPIHEVYSPGHRKQELPEASWAFLLCVARNVAAAFESVHALGHVVGDINPGGVLVSRDGTVALIDCDSFQIRHNNIVYPCHVGVSEFTPPELQGISSFSAHERTEDHDRFGLALLVFHLLLGGRHPFAGRPLRPDVGGELGKEIRAHRYAYGRDASARGVAPPPGTVPVFVVPLTVQEAFERAFTEPGVKPNARLSAASWVAALDATIKRLKPCSASKLHFYPNHIHKCPWCELDRESVHYFVITSSPFIVVTGKEINVELFRARMNAIPIPSSIPIPLVSQITTIATPLPAGLVASIPASIGDIALIVTIASIVAVFTPPWVWVFLVLFVILCWPKPTVPAAYVAEKSRRRTLEQDAKTRFDLVITRSTSVYSTALFAERKRMLIVLMDAYTGLKQEEDAAVANLTLTARARQRHAHLNRFFIDRATIKGIGQARKASLRSFGIETAADATFAAIVKVPGFGPAIAKDIMAWVRQCEAKFVFNASSAVTPADVQGVRATFAMKRKVQEDILIRKLEELRMLSVTMAAQRKSLVSELEASAAALAQATCDAEVTP